MYKRLFKTKRLFKPGASIGASTVRTVRSAIGGLILLFGSLPVWAETSGLMLSEQEAVRLGLDRPEIHQQMKAYIEVAESDIVEARTWANPEFSYDQENYDGPEDITERSYMLSQEFNLSGQRAIKTKAAKQRLDVVTQGVSQWRLERTEDIRKKFYEVLYQQQLQDIFLYGVQEWKQWKW